MRSLVDIVRKEHFINDSEYLQTLIVAVPKYVPFCSRLSSTGYGACLDSYQQESSKGLELQI